MALLAQQNKPNTQNGWIPKLNETHCEQKLRPAIFGQFFADRQVQACGQIQRGGIAGDTNKRLLAKTGPEKKPQTAAAQCDSPRPVWVLDKDLPGASRGTATARHTVQIALTESPNRTIGENDHLSSGG